LKNKKSLKQELIETKLALSNIFKENDDDGAAFEHFWLRILRILSNAINLFVTPL
jgi:hypothetical protein